jgi:hypothetical protein
MQWLLQIHLQSEEILLVALWNLMVVEGLVEYSFSGPFTTPVSHIRTGADFAGHSILAGNGS